MRTAPLRRDWLRKTEPQEYPLEGQPPQVESAFRSTAIRANGVAALTTCPHAGHVVVASARYPARMLLEARRAAPHPAQRTQISQYNRPAVCSFPSSGCFPEQPATNWPCHAPSPTTSDQNQECCRARTPLHHWRGPYLLAACALGSEEQAHVIDDGRVDHCRPRALV